MIQEMRSCAMSKCTRNFVNEALFYQKMEEANLTMAGLARGLGISRSALYNKVNGKSCFRMDESAFIAKQMNLDKVQSYQIFVSGYFEELG